MVFKQSVLPVVAMVFIAPVAGHAQQIEVRFGADPSARTVATTGTASEPEVRALARAVERSLREVVLRGAFDPGIRARTAAPVNQVALEVGADGTAVGKARLSWLLDSYNSSVDIILRGPITQSNGTPLTDRGLADGASATLTYNLTLWGSSVPAPAGVSVLSRTSTLSGRQLTTLEALIAAGLALRSRTVDAPDPTLRTLAQPTAQNAFESMDAKRIGFVLRQAGLARLQRTVAMSGSYGIGARSFTYASEIADPLPITTETREDTSFSLNVAYLQLLHDSEAEAPLLLLSGGYTNDRTHNPRRSRQICTSLNIGSAIECRAVVIGAPTKQTQESIEFDVRSWAYRQKLGINPHLSYDLLTDALTSEVSLSYLVLRKSDSADALPQLDTNALTIGVRVGFRPQEEGGPFAAVFFATVLGTK
jgi:hypothetical protein